MKIFFIAFSVFKASIRDKFLLTIVIVGFLFFAGSYTFIPISIGQGYKVIQDFGFAVIEIFTVLIAVFIGTRLIFAEIEKKTIYTIIAKPVKRWEFITGKYLGLIYLSFSVQIVFTVIFAIFLKLYTHSISVGLLKNLYFNFFELLLVDAIPIFFSTFATPVSSGIFTLILYFLGYTTIYLKSFAQLVHSPALAGFANLFYYVLPNLSIFNMKGRIVYQFSIHSSEYLLAFSYSLLYSFILMLFSYIIFEKREFL